MRKQIGIHLASIVKHTRKLVVEDSVETFCNSVTNLISEAATIYIPQRIAGEIN